MRCAIAIAITLITALALARLAGAHGEDAVLYVAEGGEDAGLCNAPDSPCRSIGYALGRAGKATEIRVAGGRYDLADAETLFHVVSGVVEIRGGYDRDHGFTRPGVTVSTLTGVPLKYREVLGSRDFHVIVDRKGLPGVNAESTDKMLAVHRSLKSGAAAEACANGMAGDLECEQVDLVGHIAFNDFRSRPSAANDIWGFIDLNSGREYVVAGFNTGTAVLDIGDPENPREVGLIPGDNSTWRDVKVLQRYDDSRERWIAYAYVTTDAASDGLFIIDLTNLPHAIDRVAHQSDFQSNHNLFLTNTDPSTGLATGDRPQYLVLAGSDRNVGQARAYALDDPESPTLVQGDAIPDSLGGDRSYAHDVAHLTIRDGRVSQCPNATTTCDLLLDFNEENVWIWDMTDIARPVRLNPGQPQYPQRGYVHSGWPTEDGQYMFVQDEADESDLGIVTRLRVFSIADLSNPELVGAWEGPTNAIDHNGFVRGNRYYMSNYSRGLTVLNITDPEDPVTAGRIDTYPFSDDTGFIGAWGVYPYFPSGVIAVSDMDSGVYLVRDRTRDVAPGSLDFEHASHAAVEGRDAALAVRRTGGTSGAVSVDYEVVRGSAGDDDYTTSFATLSWTDGDGDDRTITLSPTNDGAAEGSELLLVRLVDPTGGATLGERNVTRVHLGDPGDAATIRAFADTIEVDEDGFGRAVLVLQRHGSAAGSASVDFAVSGGSATPDDDYIGPASGTVEWPDGDANPKAVAWDIQGDGMEEAAESFDVSLSNATGAALTGAPTVRVTIATAFQPPPGGGDGDGGGNGGGSSGGAAGWAFLLLLATYLTAVGTVGAASRRDSASGSDSIAAGTPLPRAVQSRRDAAPAIRTGACGRSCARDPRRSR